MKNDSSQTVQRASQTDPTRVQLRVAVVGCGAIARFCHIPVLAGHEGFRLTAFVDHDVKSARVLAARYGVRHVFGDATELDSSVIDAALVATPPATHARLTTLLLEKGAHVLVEKPMTLTSAEANEMVAAADRANLVLSVGQFRRLFPSSRMVRAVIDSRILGAPLSFDVEEGYILDWPSATLGNMCKELAGGGVLIDTGSHTIDQLLSFFTGPASLDVYSDNSLGGCESEATVTLRVLDAGAAVTGQIELSRTRNLRNTFRITCERGVIELPVGERRRVEVRPAGVVLKDPGFGELRDFAAEAFWSGTAEDSLYRPFRAQVDDWLGAIADRRTPYLNGRSVLPTVKLIEECYRSRNEMIEPWVEEGLHKNRTATARLGVGATESVLNQRSPGTASTEHRSLGRVLVTGAAGFIGCRLVEILSFRENWQVRALVHNPGTAGRLARLRVEMVAGDLCDERTLERAIEGCDAVVHCAYGTSWGSRRAIADVTVGGTRSLAALARAAGVRRFVHISTAAVHGSRISGVLDEATPVAPDDDIYQVTKARAEKEVAAAVARGLPAVTLRLTNVYGPFSGPFTVRPVQHLVDGVPVLLGDGVNPSNTVYVDNVATAIVQALVVPGIEGEVFTISDGDDMSWAAYHGYYANALGLPMRTVPIDEYMRLKSNQGRRTPLALPVVWCRAGLMLAKSAEAQGFARRILNTDPFGYLPRQFLERFPGFKERLRELVSPDHAEVYRPPVRPRPGWPPLGLLDVYSIQAKASVEKARRMLGYELAVSRDRAMELTIEWVRYARLVSQSAFDRED